MSGLGDGALNLPYEENPSTFHTILDGVVSGGVVVMGAGIAVDGEPYPALIFRFAQPTGEFYTPMVLVVSEKEMRGIGQLVEDAARSAVEQYRKVT